MPLTLIVTEGVLSDSAINQAIKLITESMLKWHSLSGNKTMTPNVTAHANVVPKGRTFSGGEPFSGIWAEWKTPAFAFTNREVQLGHFKDCTDILYELAEGKIPRHNIYVNVSHTLDGAWNFNGVAMTNEEIHNAIAEG